MSEWILVLWLTYSKGVGLTNIPVESVMQCQELLKNWTSHVKGGYCLNTKTGMVYSLKGDK
jgi:hypothetical protein